MEQIQTECYQNAEDGHVKGKSCVFLLNKRINRLLKNG